MAIGVVDRHAWSSNMERTGGIGGRLQGDTSSRHLECKFVPQWMENATSIGLPGAVLGGIPIGCVLMKDLLRSHSEAVTQARSALTKSPVFALRGLDVAQSGERLLISGRVRTFYHKQLAQEAVRHVVNGLRLVNLVEVV